MNDIPQPSADPHEVGDQVRIYLDPGDSDIQYHDLVCEIIAVSLDDLDAETDRQIDAYSYTLRDVETGEKLPITFRHRDVVPIE